MDALAIQQALQVLQALIVLQAVVAAGYFAWLASDWPQTKEDPKS